MATPTSSHQFRNLIPILATKYDVIAPDFPGSGFTEVPANYTINFDNIAKTVGTCLEEIPNPPANFSMYIFDYGAPTGFRLALNRPADVTVIIAQNGIAYEEGLGDWWASGSADDRSALAPAASLEGTKSQYFTGTKDPNSIAPETYTLDQALLERPGNKDVQLDLFYDYRNNVAKYPLFQKWLRGGQVPLLAVWGGKDVIFPEAGAWAYRRDLSKAEVKILDAGYFALESNLEDVAGPMLDFLKKNGI